jgi:hypothetical protein
MVFADARELIGPGLAAAVLAIAALLALRQRAERRGRTGELSAADRRHFARQDVRRWVGVAVLVLIGLGISWGVQIDPRGDERSKRLFLAVWLIVILLVFFLVLLALHDLLMTRLYARRHGRALAAERREALRAPSPRRAGPPASRNGPGGEFPPHTPHDGTR